MKQQLGIVSKAGQGERISSAEALSLAEFTDLELLIETAGSIRD